MYRADNPSDRRQAISRCAKSYRRLAETGRRRPAGWPRNEKYPCRFAPRSSTNKQLECHAASGCEFYASELQLHAEAEDPSLDDVGRPPERRSERLDLIEHRARIQRVEDVKRSLQAHAREADTLGHPQVKLTQPIEVAATSRRNQRDRDLRLCEARSDGLVHQIVHGPQPGSSGCVERKAGIAREDTAGLETHRELVGRGQLVLRLKRNGERRLIAESQ